MNESGRVAPDGLPPLREIIETHGLAAKKSLGQNFLLDLNLTGRIARIAGDLSAKTVIEIGPGPGGLTRALLSHGARQVIAIERDGRCLPALEQIGSHFDGRLKIILADALETDLAALADGDTIIVANLPYNVGTPLLVGWLSLPDWPPFYSSMTLMFQREVAERISAAPGTKHYGRISVLAGWRAQAEIAFDVPPQAFWPPPKVTSSVVHLSPRAQPIDVGVDALQTVTRHAFGQRRKMLRQSLKPIGGEALLERADIAGNLRPDALDIGDFCRLAGALKD